MFLRASFLLANILLAHAETPRSPVAAAISPVSSSKVIPDLIKALDADGRKGALVALDHLDRNSLEAPALNELSEAYRLLGRSQDAVAVARTLSGRDAQSSAGDTQAVLALTQAGDYSAARATAENGLKRFPGDRNLLALLHQVKDRGLAVSRETAKIAQATVKPDAGSTDSRPAVLAIKIPKSVSEVPKPGPQALEYVPEGARRLTATERFWKNAMVLYAMAFPKQDAHDVADRQRLRKALDASETGRGLVAELGGWDGIDKSVDVRMANLPAGTGGLSIPLKITDEKGRNAVLLLSRDLMKENDAVSASVLAHELRHIVDFKRGDGNEALSMQSEYSAHRVQIRTFLEMTAGMTDAQKKSASGRYLWEYSKFIANLWTDHILSRFPEKDKFKAFFANRKIAAMAGEAYQDLDSSRVAAGSAHLDYHLNAPDRGIYTLLTDEKDIVDIVKSKQLAGAQPTAEERRALKRRNELTLRMDKDDDDYRRIHGFSLNGTK